MRLRLTPRAALTLTAALHAWQNELGYHTVEELAAWHPELKGEAEPLSIAEVDALLARLEEAAMVARVRELEVRYRSRKLPLPVEGSVSNPREAAQLAAQLLADATVEKVLALHLNVKHRLIGVHTVSVGTLDASLVHPREVFSAALLSKAAALVVAHNHPSGDPTPLYVVKPNRTAEPVCEERLPAGYACCVRVDSPACVGPVSSV